MSAPESAPAGAAVDTAHGKLAASAPGIGVTLATVTTDIVELGAFGGRAPELTALATSRGVTLPAFGRSIAASPIPAASHTPAASPAGATAAPATPLQAPALVLCVRPDRWLLLSPPAAPAADAAPGSPQPAESSAAVVAAWSAATAGVGAAVDLSAGLTALLVRGSAVRDVLARACRLDLHPTVFPVGHAAATQMVQVSVILVALPSGMLLLTPSTTARHVREWLAATAQPFGFAPRAAISLGSILR